MKCLLLVFACFVSFSFEEDEGFVDLFDGKSLEGWDGDSVYWSVKDGGIVGEVTAETLLDRNSFLIWRGQVDGAELRGARQDVSRLPRAGSGFEAGRETRGCEGDRHPPELQKSVKKEDWNTYRIVAEGNVMRH